MRAFNNADIEVWGTHASPEVFIAKHKSFSFGDIRMICTCAIKVGKPTKIQIVAAKLLAAGLTPVTDNRFTAKGLRELAKTPPSEAGFIRPT